MKNLVKIIFTQIINLLVNEGKSATFAVVTAMVEVKQLKTGNPFAKNEIRKRVVYQFLLNGNYTRMVNAKRQKEASEKGETAEKFEAKDNYFRKVFDNDNGNIVCHKDDCRLDEKGNFVEFTTDDPRLYLLGAINNNPNNKTKTLGYFIDGRPATEEETAIIKSFVPKPSENKSQDLDVPILVRTITLTDFAKHKGIEKITCNGVTTEFGQVF